MEKMRINCLKINGKLVIFVKLSGVPQAILGGPLEALK